MNMPDQINIMGLDYDILEVDVIERGTNICGQIDHIEQVIKIGKDLKCDRKEQTLVHEVVHGILEQLGYMELHDNEQLVQSLAVALHQTFKQVTFS